MALLCNQCNERKMSVTEEGVLCSFQSSFNNENCPLCSTIRNYKLWHSQGKEEFEGCHSCGLKENCWCCLECCFVGCGRYSSQHAKFHFESTGHNYTLELASSRIWDYQNDRFVYGPSESMNILNSSSNYNENAYGNNLASQDKHLVQKLSSISEEYESRLADELSIQRQRFDQLLSKASWSFMQEGYQGQFHDEISSLNDHSSLPFVTEEEMNNIESLKLWISSLEQDLTKSEVLLCEYEEKLRQINRRNNKLLSACKIKKEKYDAIEKDKLEECRRFKDNIEELEQQLQDLAFHNKAQATISSSGLTAEELNTPILITERSSGSKPDRRRGTSTKGSKKRK